MRSHAFKSYRVHLASAQRLSGTAVDGVYTVNLGEVLDPTLDWQVALETYVADTYQAVPMAVMLPSYPRGNEYSSWEQGPSSVLALLGNVAPFTSRVNMSSPAARLNDPTFLRNSQLRIVLQSVTAAPLNPAFSWGMTLVVTPVPKHKCD